MDFLAGNTIQLQLGPVKVIVPHPANFALLKLIVSARRTKPVKQENDRRQAVEVMRALLESGREKSLTDVFADMPKTWKKTVRAQIGNLPLAEDIAAVLATP